jgi:NAD(P)-dependent dehydrogenase (short-subunit alcohol dehydrogenase family)
MKPRDFDGKNVFVVGGSTGIGLAVAKRIAALGADVTIFARRREPLVQAVEEIERDCRRPAQRVSWWQLDVADRDRVQEVMGVAVEEMGVPDVLINCAGRAYPDHFENISPEQFAETMTVNLHGCWNTVSALVPRMKEKGGYVVNTSSLAGLIGVFGYTDYCASKFALVGFSEALRSELKPHGIVVSVLCPTDTLTPAFEKENETKPKETWAVSEGARIMSAEDVATALISGMAKGSFLIIPGTDGRLTALAKRLFPKLVERWMDRRIRKARERA